MIDFYKKLLGLTSEDMFGVSKQPPEQCPLVYSVNEVLDEESYNIYEEIKTLNREFDGYDTGTLEWAAHNVEGLESELEKLRLACEAIRSWGQEWKDLALRVMSDKSCEVEYMTEKTLGQKTLKESLVNQDS